MFFLLLPFLISINIPTSLGADDGRFTNCRDNTFSCGSIQNIKYPFWGDNRPHYCGLPDCQLNCEGNIPKITMQSLQYRILHVNESSNILTVVSDDYYDTFCPIDYKNNTFDSTFTYADGLLFVTFLYDCNTTTSFPSNILRQDCNRVGVTYTVYYFLGQVDISDCKSVIMPVQPSQTQNVLTKQIDSALHEGFGLLYLNGNNEECDTCTKSGGECGYDGEFFCFCKEGPQSYLCLLQESSDDDRFTSCNSNSFSCGDNIPSLKYPFWGDKRPQYCGLPDFQLICEGNITKIIIQSIKYRILDLERTSQILTVSRDDDVLSCPSDPSHYKNNTFDSTPFKYVDGLANVTFLLGCNNTTSFPSNIWFEDCYRDRDTYTRVYYVLGLKYVSHCKSVIMPVQLANQTQAVMTISSEILMDAFYEGFGLKWMVNNEQCDNCTKSGGECGDVDGQFFCFCKEGPPNNSSCYQGSSGSTKKLTIAISAGVGGIALISILIIYTCNKRSRKEKAKTFKRRTAYHGYNLQSFMTNYDSLALRQYSYTEVKRMTKSFSDKLGEGGYGVVYKASLPDGRLVAVKVIRKSKASGEEFINEVASISKTSHVNIVTLLGFCYEKNKRVLIYEYISKGSLDNFIYKRGSPNAFCTLEWRILYQVAIGIAQGLEYLHWGCSTRILHLDIKPQNILLDEEFCLKVSDFGLAKICQKKESIVSILGTRGIIGFIAPEIFNRAFGGVSHKFDVYSYGMLVLEMVGGRKNYHSGGSHTERNVFSRLDL